MCMLPLHYTLVRQEGLEPSSAGFEGLYSIQLNYRRILRRGQDLNLRAITAHRLATEYLKPLSHLSSAEGEGFEPPVLADTTFQEWHDKPDSDNPPCALVGPCVPRRNRTSAKGFGDPCSAIKLPTQCTPSEIRTHT